MKPIIRAFSTSHGGVTRAMIRAWLGMFSSLTKGEIKRMMGPNTTANELYDELYDELEVWRGEKSAKDPNIFELTKLFDQPGGKAVALYLTWDIEVRHSRSAWEKGAPTRIPQVEIRVGIFKGRPDGVTVISYLDPTTAAARQFTLPHNHIAEA